MTNYGWERGRADNSARYSPQDRGSRNKMINRQVTRAAESGNIGALFKVIRDHISEMNGINLATSFHRIAKLATGNPAVKLQEVKSHQCFVALFDQISYHIAGDVSAHGTSKHADGEEIPVQCLSIVAWSCASLRIRNESLFANIATKVVPCLATLKPYELSNLLWAYTKMGLLGEDLSAPVIELFLGRHHGEFKVQCLSTIAWCFASAQLRNVAVFASIAEEIAAHAHEAKPQQISTTLWAFAKNRHSSPELFEALGHVALKDANLENFKLQELSNTAWAFATAGLRNTEMFAEIERVTLSRIGRIEPQSVANMLWAFAKSQALLQTDLFTRLLDFTLSRQSQFKPEELSAVVWAAAQIYPAYDTFFDTIMHTCVRRLPEFSINGVANLIKSLAVVQTNQPACFNAMLQSSMKFLPKCRPTALCSLLHGAAIAVGRATYAQQKHLIGDALDKICSQIMTRLREFRKRDIVVVSQMVHDTRIILAMGSSDVLRQLLSMDVVLKLSQCADVEVESVGSPEHESGDDEFMLTASGFTPERNEKHNDSSQTASWNPLTYTSTGWNNQKKAWRPQEMNKKPLRPDRFQHPQEANDSSGYFGSPWSLNDALFGEAIEGNPAAGTWMLPVDQKDDGPWKIPVPAYSSANNYDCFHTNTNPLLPYGMPQYLRC